eukprot:TRINITY_DN26_c0_g1_i1.p1 TRINITY_DN26_c0_g1~~TRINITY_DN26_c0_g1_i1.p1  ORF type:complete len:121 (-),score=23.14 TRINITY_DN26_c0_g1_i1:12-374(-)
MQNTSTTSTTTTDQTDHNTSSSTSTSTSTSTSVTHQPELLALPAPGEGANTYKDIPKLDVTSGETLAMDWLGPLVVHENGKLSRITNWDSMTEDEKERTKRLVCERNRKRLAVLRGQYIL